MNPAAVPSRAVRILVASFALMLMVVPSALAAGPPDQSLLWSTTAKTLTIGKAGKHYTITAPATSPTVWFTDRPGRTAGTTNLAGFVGGWETNRFDKTAPNAAIVLRRNGTTMQSVVVLTRPRELANGNLRFNARIIRTGEVMAMKTRDMTLPTGTYRNASLFIDAGDAPACPATITTPGWCTLQSTNDVGATTTVDLETPNKAEITRTIKTCYWKGNIGYVGATLYYNDVSYDGPLSSYTLDKRYTTQCNSPSFSALDDSIWTFAPVNSYYLYPPRVKDTRNKRVVLTLNSRKTDWGSLWRLYSSPKALIVVTDS